MVRLGHPMGQPRSFAAEATDVSATASDIAAGVPDLEKLAMSLMRLTLLWLKEERLFQPRMQKRLLVYPATLAFRGH